MVGVCRKYNLFSHFVQWRIHGDYITAGDRDQGNIYFFATGSLPDTGKTIYVDDGSTDDPENHRWNTIQEGLGDADPGDTVFICAGTYYENVEIKNIGITIQGEDKDIVVIDAGCTGDGLYLLNADYVNISNITVQNSGAWQSAGVRLDSSSNCNITDIAVVSNPYSGITVMNSSLHNTVMNNFISDNAWGIFLDNSTNNTIANNILHNNSTAIYPYYSNNNTVCNCTLVSNETGISAYGSAITITNCILWNNGHDLHSCTATYSDIGDGDEGEGNISAHPMFVNSAEGNYHLHDFSPCIGTGTSTQAPDKDIEGAPRPAPSGSHPDMGAFENILSAPIIPADSDGDSLIDNVEVLLSTDLDDLDTDDDGIPDGDEDTNHNGIVDNGETDPTKADTDSDGIQDGTEIGIAVPIKDPDDSGHLRGTDKDIFIPDADPTTTTDPLDTDTDDDGIGDGLEDINHNGMVNSGETDPGTIDTDGDGIQDGTESGYTLPDIWQDTDVTVFKPDLDPLTTTDPLDTDTDDDGIGDGLEDINHDGMVNSGETDPGTIDTDGDGLQDGTESGYTLPDIQPDTDVTVFKPDLDPLTTTDPLDVDMDDDGLYDGEEDINHNGRLDPNETEPSFDILGVQVGNRFNFQGNSLTQSGYILTEKCIRAYKMSIAPITTLLVETREGENLISERWMSKEGGELRLVGEKIIGDEIMYFSPGIIYYWFPMQIGENKKIDVLASDSHQRRVLSQTVQVLSKDTLSFPFGTLEAYKVYHQINYPDSPQMTYYLWVVPYLGWVKYESDDSRKILSDFAVRGGAITEITDLPVIITDPADPEDREDNFGGGGKGSCFLGITAFRSPMVDSSDTGGPGRYSSSAIITVDDDSPADYSSIQDAINAAVDNDTILVMPGIYMENIDFLGKAITVKSDAGAENTIIDGGSAGNVVTFQSGEGLDSVLDGFTITKAKSYKGGVWCSQGSATIINNIVKDNAGYGVLLYKSRSVVRNNIIYGNPDLDTGPSGAIRISEGSPLIENNKIFATDSNGNISAITILDSEFNLPQSFFISSNVIKGRIFIDDSSPISVFENEISNNIIVIENHFSEAMNVNLEGKATLLIANNVIHKGGGIFLQRGGDKTRIINNIITGCNTGIEGCSGYSDILNNNLWGNDSNYNCIPNHTGIKGNISADPRFVDPVNGDYHLQPCSPCIDAGTNKWATDKDFEGDMRPQFNLYDIGIDEYAGLPDSDGDCLADDFEAGLGTDLNDLDTDDDGIPDGDEDTNHNGIVDNGETDPTKADTDSDGIQDGTEIGITEPIKDPDDNGHLLGTDKDIFIPDADPTTTTDPLDTDTDDDGLNDGEEDLNHNGKLNPGETDPAYNPIDIFGLETNNVWTYKGTYQGGSYSRERKVINFDQTASPGVYVMISKRNETIEGIELYEKTSGELRFWGYMEGAAGDYSCDFSNGLLTAWYPMTVGDHKESSAELISDSNVIVSMVVDVQSDEPVPLDFDTIQAYKLRYQFRLRDNGKDKTKVFSQWVAPYLGIVKYQDEESQEILVSFSIGDGTINQGRKIIPPADSDNKSNGLCFISIVDFAF